jgi:drug/metabolite transporter (DMT)-like permease
VDLHTGFLLTVTSSVGWAALDATRKVLAERMRPVPLLFLMTSFSVPIFLFWALTSSPPGAWVTSPGYWLPAGASVALNVVANLLYFRAVTVSPFSQMVPLLSLTPMFTALAAIPLVGEYPTPRQWVGIGAATLGALVLQSGVGRSLGQPWRSFIAEPGAPLMTGVALLWSVASALDKAAIRHAEGLFHGLVLNGGVAVVLLVVLLARREMGLLRGLPAIKWPLALALAVGVAALGLQLRAYGHWPVGIVETVKRGVGCLLALLAGRLFFQEAITDAKLLATLLMIAGVALILM